MFLSKYATARHIYVPMVKRAVVDFAVGADWTPVAGDVKVSKDGGAAANVTNLPSAIAMGNGAIWDFSLTSGELTAAQITVTVADSATKAVEDNAFSIETYGNASAQHGFDLSSATVLVAGLIKKNAAFSNFTFMMTDSTTHAPKTGIGSGCTCTRRIDSGSFASTTNGATEVANGWYTIDLSAADVNGRVISLRITASASDDRNIQIITVD